MDEENNDNVQTKLVQSMNDGIVFECDFATRSTGPHVELISFTSSIDVDSPELASPEAAICRDIHDGACSKVSLLPRGLQVVPRRRALT